MCQDLRGPIKFQHETLQLASTNVLVHSQYSATKQVLTLQACADSRRTWSIHHAHIGQLLSCSFEQVLLKRSPSRKGLKVEKVSKSNHKNPILAPPHKGAIFFCSHPLNLLEKSKIPSPGCLTPSDSLNRLQETLGRKGVCIETHSRGYNVVRTCPWCAIG